MINKFLRHSTKVHKFYEFHEFNKFNKFSTIYGIGIRVSEKMLESRKSIHFQKNYIFHLQIFAGYFRKFHIFRLNYDFILLNAFVTQYSNNIQCICVVFFAVFSGTKLPYSHDNVHLCNCGIVQCGSGLNVVIYVYILYVLSSNIQKKNICRVP